MLGKLIKYDLRFGAKKYAFMSAMVAALLAVSALAMLFRNQTVFVMFLITAIIATIAFAVVYIVVSIQHLYSQLCSRESYLNYSLPVSPHSLILSKIITILFWGVVTTLIIILFWVTAVSGITLAETGRSIGEWWNALADGIKAEAGFDFNVTMLLSLVMGCLQFVMTVCLAVFCVSLSNLPYLKERNWGIATGVAGFLVLYNVIGLIPVFIYWLSEKIGGNADPFGINTTVLYEDMGGALTVTATPWINDMMSGLTWVSGVVYVLFAAVFYLLAVKIADKHRFIG